MLLYYLKCRKNTASKKPKLVKTKNARIMGASNCVLCSSKRSRFIKEYKAILLSSSFRK